MDVQIISREIVKPSTPTPNEKRTYKLSLLDRLVNPSYTNVVLFYSKPECQNFGSRNALSDHLKTSLSHTLVYFYPFAGCYKNLSFIDCWDSGVSYVVANVDMEVSAVLARPNFHVQRQLLAITSGPDAEEFKDIFREKNEETNHLSERPLMCLQVNFFACGGVAVGVSISHVVADVAAFVSFVTGWATSSLYLKDRNEKNGSGSTSAFGSNYNVVINCASVFPPKEELIPVIQGTSATFGKVFNTENSKSTRFIFEKSKIDGLKERLGNLNSDRPVSRFLAICALLWGATIALTQDDKDHTTAGLNKNKTDSHLLLIALNIRNRMNPPIDPKYIGNFTDSATVWWPLDTKLDVTSVAEKISQSLREINNENFMEANHASHLIKFNMSIGEHIGKCPKNIFAVSSLCNFPFYKCDFGWGKPIWWGPAGYGNNAAILFDTKDGGVEAWVTLPVEAMAKFQQNPEILQYASF